MKSAFWRTLAIVAIVAMPTLANANDATIGSEAAHSSMRGTTLNNTTALLNAWPHLAVYNGTGAELVSQSLVGDADDGGRARVWWEAYDELWLNMQVGRTDLGGQAANFLWGGNRAGDFFMPSMFGNAAGNLNALDNPWINVGIAKPLTSGAWAVNVLWAAETNTNDAAGADNDQTVEDSALGYGLQASWGNGNGLHLSTELTLQSETDESLAGGEVQSVEGDFLNFSLNARYDTDLYIYQGSFVFGTGGPSDNTDETAFGFLANAGRFLKNEVDGQTSVEFVGSYFNLKTEPGDSEVTNTTFMIPGVRVAAWEKISDHFGIMGAVTGQYELSSTEDLDGVTTEGTPVDSSSGDFDYDWSAGLFAQPTENVRIDFQFVKENLGKTLSLGNNDPLVWYLGATVGLN